MALGMGAGNAALATTWHNAGMVIQEMVGGERVELPTSSV
jgi:hypothetical protein